MKSAAGSSSSEIAEDFIKSGDISDLGSMSTTSPGENREKDLDFNSDGLKSNISKTYNLVTVFASTKDEFDIKVKHSQDHIDELFRIRDKYATTREEIDEYTSKFSLKPSKEYSDNRIIPETKKVEGKVL
jgi:hypothetical protein